MTIHSDWAWTRRTFLQTSAMTLALAVLPGLRPQRAVAQALPEGRLTFLNVWTNERLEVTYRNEAGEYDWEALDDVNHILRCHATGEVSAIDVRVLEHVNLVQKKIGGDREVHIISGYRSPEYNAKLVRAGRRAAKNSLHIQGQAMDIQIPGIHPKVIRQTALELGYGGIGYYPRSKFVHLDSGAFRSW
ncbi:MAG: hypothetical protein LZF86_40098 [Nitrospira sp.]|nr:MAG: hypothetical protein LZF86_40098 [Nitrospira sp.]